MLLKPPYLLVQCANHSLMIRTFERDLKAFCDDQIPDLDLFIKRMCTPCQSVLTVFSLLLTGSEQVCTNPLPCTCILVTVGADLRLLATEALRCSLGVGEIYPPFATGSVYDFRSLLRIRTRKVSHSIVLKISFLAFVCAPNASVFSTCYQCQLLPLRHSQGQFEYLLIKETLHWRTARRSATAIKDVYRYPQQAAVPRVERSKLNAQYGVTSSNRLHALHTRTPTCHT